MRNLKAWACLQSPPNLLDLAIKKEKIITKQKALATSADGNEKFPYRPTCHSRDVNGNKLLKK
ncbi:hypothetical protein [Maribacter ulvicola]|uniref:hypothetical protein n=1 Tax=Maribacter ulvicola TaxID=228959 RepID=UPI00117ED3A9|nr:hypothetical protein [Maribacter ulvicola]